MSKRNVVTVYRNTHINHTYYKYGNNIYGFAHREPQRSTAKTIIKPHVYPYSNCNDYFKKQKADFVYVTRFHISTKELQE